MKECKRVIQLLPWNEIFYTTDKSSWLCFKHKKALCGLCRKLTTKGSHHNPPFFQALSNTYKLYMFCNHCGMVIRNIDEANLCTCNPQTTLEDPFTDTKES